MTLAIPLLLLVLLSACSPPQEENAGGSDVTTLAPIGTIVATQGEAFVHHAGARVKADKGTTLDAGDELETGDGGKLRVLLSDQSTLAIGAGTRLMIREFLVDDLQRTGRLEVTLGKFWMNVTKWTGAGPSHYEITTPNAVAGVRGTTLWGDTQVDAICALEGSIEVSSLKDASLKPVTLTAGNCAAELSLGKLAALTPTSQQIDAYLRDVLIPPDAP